MKALAVGIVLFGFAALAIVLISRSAPRTARAKVPAALRPGDIDEVLETDRLSSIARWGFATTLFFAFFLLVYFLAEPGKRESKTELFEKQSLDRGRYYYALGEDPITGDHPPRGVGRPAGDPIECARCHGVNAEGGENEFLNPVTGQQSVVKVPELQTVFARYATPPLGYRDARAFIRETIERGRPGTDMPTWGNRYGGPLTDQQIDDIIFWLESIQKPIEVEKEASGADIFAQFCATCHGNSGTGGSGPAMVGGSEVRQFPNIDDHIAFVKSGSTRGQRYGTSGTGTGGMPPWEGTLTEEQIRLVVEYERTL